MTAPRPWKDEGRDGGSDAARLVSLVAGVAPRPVDRASWDDVLARAAAPRRDWRLVPAFAVSVLAGALLVVAGRAVMAPEPAAPPAAMAHTSPVLTPSPGARFSHGPSERVVLTEGRLAIAALGPAAVHLETPQVQLEAHHARFLAEVIQGGTRVSVEEGEVVVRTPAGAQTLVAGESTVWPPAPEIPEALLAEPVDAAPSCAEATGAARLECLAVEGQRQGLEAQAALYELGALEARAGHPAQAEAAFRASLERFPEGVLHPEVRLALLVELIRGRRFADAVREAEDFERQCPGDPRVGDVAALRRALEALAQP